MAIHGPLVARDVRMGCPHAPSLAREVVTRLDYEGSFS